MKNNKYLAFTLIEVMIAVAIVAILAAVAVPSYRTYLQRSQVTDGVTVANRVKDFTTNYYLKYGKMPANTDLAKEFATTVVNTDQVAVGSVSTAYVGYPGPYYSNCTYSIIQLVKPVGSTTRNTFYVGVKDNGNGSFLVLCGLWSTSAPGATDISDPTYMPSGCNATNVSTICP